MMTRILNATSSFLNMRSNHSDNGSLRGKCNLSYEKVINPQSHTQGQTRFSLSSVIIKLSRFLPLLNISGINHFIGRAERASGREEKFAAVSCRLRQGSSNRASLFNRRRRQSGLGIQSRQIFGCICRSRHCATYQSGKIAACCSFTPL